tara:strand:+ start:15577 stop:16821 length:1245 start_codon:yes stop_codon:yes gene_type:complete
MNIKNLKKSIKPLVSILIPTRDRPKELRMALISALNQSYKNIEIIVHDNSVKNDIKKIIEDLLEDGRVNYFKTKTDLSMKENWNQGFSHCKGDYFVRLDDDNVYKPNFIKDALDQIDQRNLSMMVFSCIYTDLHNTEYLLHKKDSNLYELTKELYFFIEFNAFTDSNYAIYSMDTLKHILLDGFDLYDTNLPDRFLHYRIIEKMESHSIKVGFSTIPMGVSRYDYRPRYKKDFRLKMLDFQNFFNSDEIIINKDCSENFTLHRLLTANFFFKKFNSELEIFFNERVLSKVNYLSFAKAGHISQCKSEYSLSEIKNFNVFMISLILNIIRHPNKIFDGKRNITFLFRYILIMMNRNRKFLLNFFLNKERYEDVVDTSFGDNICQEVIDGTYDDNSIKSNHNFYKDFYSKYSKEEL